ncbi:MAG TPA: hypothetical protein VGM06_21720 [Polyangiaceae bacterium]|jgi:hypothetical protein
MLRAKPPQPPRPSLVSSFALAATGLAGLLGLCASGCTPAIGDHCTLSTDCSVQGNRICDTFEPNGYCTVTCSANSCPDNATCIEFAAGIPGCGYNDYSAPSRLGRSMCMKTCGSDSDCRTDEGYSCVSTLALGSTVAVLDTNQTQSICMVAPGVAEDGGSSSLPVCTNDRPDAPPLDLPGDDAGAGADDGEAGAVDGGAEAGPIDAGADGEGGVADGGADARAVEAGAATDGGTDAGAIDGGADVAAGDGGGQTTADGGDAASAGGGDATIDGGDDGSDATLGQPTDAGAADAPDEP